MQRYLFRGLIDGSLSTLGVIIGAQSAGVGVILAAGIGGGVANGLSNILGAFTAEKSATEKKLAEIRKAMVFYPQFKKTELYRNHMRSTIISGIMDGVATIAGSMVPLIPFILSLILKIGKTTALAISIALTLTLLFVIGSYIGRISKENLVIAGVKMAVAGIATAMICTAIERFVTQSI